MRRVAKGLILMSLFYLVGHSPDVPAQAAAPQSAAPGQAPTPQEQLREFLAANRFAAAESLARANLAEVLRRREGDSLSGAHARDLLVEALRRSGKGAQPEALETAESSLVVKERILGPDDIDVAVSANHIGVIHYLAGDFARAKPAFERVVAIREKVLGPEDLAVSHGLNNLGETLRNLGDHQAARPIIARALAIKVKVLGAEHPDALMTRMNLGLVAYDTGDLSASRTILEETLALREKALGSDHLDVAQSLNNLGNLLREMGELGAAKELLERALAIREKAYGRDHSDVGTTLTNLAIVQWQLGDFERGQSTFERALSVYEKTVGAEHPEYAAVLNNLGYLHQTNGDLPEARAAYERALAILEKRLGPDHFDVAQTTINLARVLRDMHEDDASARRFERGMAATEKAVGPDHAQMGFCLLEQAPLLQRRGLQAEAEAGAERGVAIYERSYGPRHPDLAAALATQARILESHDAPRALAIALRAEQIRRDHLTLTLRSLPERQALQYTAFSAGGLNTAVRLAEAESISPHGRAQAMDAVIRSRSLVLDETATRHGVIHGTADSSVRILVQEWTAASQRLANLMVRASASAGQDVQLQAIEKAGAEQERAEQALAAKSGEFRKHLARDRTGFAEVLKALSPGTALVSYVRRTADQGSSGFDSSGRDGSAGEYLAFVLQAGRSSPAVVPLGSSREIDSLVVVWRRDASHAGVGAPGGSPDRVSGEALRRRIWDPLVRSFGSSRKVYVVPEGSLHLVSLPGLPMGKDRYLIESRPTIQFLSTERDLLPGSNPPGLGHGLLAIGGAAFDAPPPDRQELVTNPSASAAQLAHGFRGARSDCPRFRTARFRPLPGTIREIEAIASLWNQSIAALRRGATDDSARTLTDGAANEATFKARCAGRRVVHLATHGFFLSKECTASREENDRGIGGLVEPAGQAPGPRPGPHPLQLSGLALASANHRDEVGPEQEDGVLTAEEVATLDLSGVEWAVLSACETGIGEIQANEGVFGLQRAFRVAGARTVIMSLWAVEDESAREWMIHLYRARHLEGLATAEAVRQASLRVLKERRRRGLSTSPYTWSAFIASGE